MLEKAYDKLLLKNKELKVNNDIEIFSLFIENVASEIRILKIVKNTFLLK